MFALLLLLAAALQHYMYGTGEGESGEGISMRMRPWRIHHRPPQSADEDWDFSKGSINFWEAMIEWVSSQPVVFCFLRPPIVLICPPQIELIFVSCRSLGFALQSLLDRTRTAQIRHQLHVLRGMF